MDEFAVWKLSEDRVIERDRKSSLSDGDGLDAGVGFLGGAILSSSCFSFMYMTKSDVDRVEVVLVGASEIPRMVVNGVEHMLQENSERSG